MKFIIFIQDVIGSDHEHLMPFNQTIDNREYIGFKKVDSIGSYVRVRIIIFIFLKR